MTDFEFNPGQKVIVHGMLDHPEENGTILTILTSKKTAITEYCLSGNAYYFHEDLKCGLDYLFEERLKLVE